MSKTGDLAVAALNRANVQSLKDSPMYDEYRMAQNALHEAEAIKAGPVITLALRLYLATLELEREEEQ